MIIFSKNYEKKIFRVFVPHKNTQNNKMRCKKKMLNEKFLSSLQEEQSFRSIKNFKLYIQKFHILFMFRKNI